MFYKNLLMVTFLAFIFFVSDNKAQTNKNQNMPINYSELIQNKDSYLGKTVRVKAFYVWGFEWEFLCGKDCKTRRNETWVEFGELCKGSKQKLKKGNDKFLDNKAEVVFEGVLSEGHFGHQNGYKFQFTVGCVEKFKLVKPN
jgi:hypothetical protein